MASLLKLLVLFLQTQAIYGAAMNIQAPVGNIDGIEIPVDNKNIHAYLGIPFAKPPIENLRFAKPEPHESFVGTFNASQFGPTCIQMASRPNMTMSEDCLTLNVYVPPEAYQNGPVAVIVWIYGGAFTFGQSHTYDPTTIVALGDVVFVTLNYRLGAFGFLSTEDSSAPGNFGLWDQHLAIKWVSNNIASFGGDHTKVTIIGESAGAASVGHHSLATMSRGLFHRIILQSGSANAIWAIATNTLHYARRLGILLECSESDTKRNVALMSCLRDKSASDILTQSFFVDDAPYEERVFHTIWAPVVDQDFIHDHPRNVIKDMTYLQQNTDFLSYDSIYDVVNKEGGIFYSSLNQLPEGGRQALYNREFYKNVYLRGTIMREFSQTSQLAVDVFNSYYKDWSLGVGSAETVNPEEYMDITGDTLFFIPSLVSAMQSSMGQGRTYYYYFDHVPSYRLVDIVHGITHGEDVPFTFGTPEDLKQMSTEERSMSHAFIMYMTNFAKTG